VQGLPSPIWRRITSGKKKKTLPGSGEKVLLVRGAFATEKEEKFPPCLRLGVGEEKSAEGPPGDRGAPRGVC